MSGIFGVIFRDGSACTTDIMESMCSSMQDWGRDKINYWQEGSAGLGHALTSTTAEACFEHQPYADQRSGIVFTAAARVDNRLELSRSLNITQTELSKLSDGDLVWCAYRQWGKNATSRIYGDWAFSAWHPAEKRLFLARDHLGNTALYYYIDDHVVAFSSSRQSLLKLKLSPVALDELYLAQILISWPAYHGERTIHKPIRRLPPAHTLDVTPDKVIIGQYWYLEKMPVLHLPKREDYVSAFLEVFDEAVRARLRTPKTCDEAGTVAATLSGGLDSGSITATAAGLLKGENRRLKAYTSVPLSDTLQFAGDRIGDEFPFAEATAKYSKNVDLTSVFAEGISPIQGIRLMLKIMNEPAHAAGNFYWLLQLEQIISEQGGKVLLTGQMGNAGISWVGNLFSQPLEYQLQKLGFKKWLKDLILRKSPPKIVNAYRLQRQKNSEWCRSSAIRPEFARRLCLLERRLSAPEERPPRPELIKRLFLKPGRDFCGAIHAEMGASFGIEVRDPSADARVLEYTFSVPDHIFMDPRTDMDRWLIREAMKGRLPDQVRLNQKYGQQAGDLVIRLRKCALEVETALNELEHGPAAEYVDVTYMCQVWHKILVEDTYESFSKSVTVLTRGIMAGLFVNSFYE